MNPGKVTLVGAGPGDPDLLTLKALKAIQGASLLLVDDLVSPEVLAHASAHARIMRVGKRGGLRSTPQDFIDRLMLRAARRGEHVVRLKGGDPFIFGRGGEEVERLRAAGVTVEVVNGIALTHRAHAQGVVFLTGHARSGAEAPDWATLAVAARDLAPGERAVREVPQRPLAADRLVDRPLLGVAAALAEPCPSSPSSLSWIS